MVSFTCANEWCSKLHNPVHKENHTCTDAVIKDIISSMNRACTCYRSTITVSTSVVLGSVSFSLWAVPIYILPLSRCFYALAVYPLQNAGELIQAIDSIKTKRQQMTRSTQITFFLWVITVILCAAILHNIHAWIFVEEYCMLSISGKQPSILSHGVHLHINI